MVKDQELINSFNKGDSKAFNVLFHRYNDKLVNLIRSKQSDMHCEDVAQEAWLSVIINIKYYNQNNFFHWIYRISINKFIDLYVRKKVLNPAEIIDNMETGDTYTEPHEKDVDVLRMSILKLENPRYKEIIMLRTYKGLSFNNIKEIFKTGSVNTTSGQYRYAVSNLKKMMIK